MKDLNETRPMTGNAEEVEGNDPAAIPFITEMSTLLAASSLFSTLSPQEREEILNRATVEAFPAGSLVLQEGAPGDSMYIIQKGEVEVFTHHPPSPPVTLARLKEGDFFGEISFVTGRPRTASVKVLQAAELVRLAKKDFDPLMARHPEVTELLDKTIRLRIEDKLKTYSEYLEDVVRERTAELRAANEQLELEIAELRRAEDRIKASLEEKVVLLKEIHHRVKNNLQIVSSLLRLQSRHVTGREAAQVFLQSQNRIRTIALIHEKLYQSPDFRRIDFAGYARDLAAHVYRSLGADMQAIPMRLEGEIDLGMDKAIPCGLLLNELLTNALKHAFPGGRGEIRIGIHAAEGRIHLRVADNGVGLPPQLDIRKTESLGLQLVDSLIEQLDATLELGREKGTHFHISFPEQARKSGYLD